jgi:hypothetical protein
MNLVDNGFVVNGRTNNFGVSNNGRKILGDQISSGITPTQMQNEYPSGTVTVPRQFSANTGISGGLEPYLTSIIGKAVTIPICDQSGINGNNA